VRQRLFNYFVGADDTIRPTIDPDRLQVDAELFPFL
jgi:hypothetical protein